MWAPWTELWLLDLAVSTFTNTEPSPWPTDPSKSQLSRKSSKERISASLHYGNLEIKGQKMKLGKVKSDGSLQTDFI